MASKNFNEVLKNGAYLLGSTVDGYVNAPNVPSLEGVLFVKESWDKHYIQIYIGIQNNSFHYRTCYGNDWRAWKSL